MRWVANIPFISLNSSVEKGGHNLHFAVHKQGQVTPDHIRKLHIYVKVVCKTIHLFHGRHYNNNS